MEIITLFLIKKLDAFEGNPVLKLNSIAEITKIAQKYDLCDIYRIRNPDTKRFTFAKKTPRLLRRLDFFSYFKLITGQNRRV